MDGHKQREALAAAERSLLLLQKNRPADALEAAARAAALDQVGVFGGLPDAIARVAAFHQAAEPVPSETWAQLADVVGPGPLAAHIAELRDDG